MRRITLVAGSCVVVAAAVLAFVLADPAPAQQAPASGPSVADLKKALQARPAPNLALQALEKLRRSDAEGVEDALAELAAGKNPLLAAQAAATLGRKGSEAARTKLKALVVNSTLKDEVRKSAMTALAAGFADEDDLEWMEDVLESNAGLKGYCAYIKTEFYGN